MRRSEVLYLAAVLPVLFVAPVIAQPPPTFTPEEMLRVAGFVRGSEPLLSASGDLAAYAVVDVSDERNIRAARPTGVLWVTQTRGGAPQRITSGDVYGVQPVWSPEGTQLAFLQSDSTGSRLAIWDRSNQRVRPVGPSLGSDRAGLPLGALAPRWTPDGKTIVLAVSDAVVAGAETPRVRVLKNTDAIVPGDAFFTDTRRWRLVTVEVATDRVRAVTPEAMALRGFDLAPDGRHLLYRAVSPQSLGQFRREQTESWIAPVTAEWAPRRALETRTPAWIAFSPDGSRLLYAQDGVIYGEPVEGGSPARLVDKVPARARAPVVGSAGRIALLSPRAGAGAPDQGMYSILRPANDLLVVDVGSGAVSTLTVTGRDDAIADVVWSADGTTLMFRATDQATYRESIRRWQPGMDAPEEVLAADESLGALSLTRDGRTVAFTASSAVRSEDGYVQATDGIRRRLTELNPGLARFPFVAPERIEYFSADGEALQGLLYKPAGASASAPVPVVTYVYEKLSPQVHQFNQEAQLHVSHGYAYLMPDVLVKPGYTGESFVKSVVPAVNAVRAMGFTNGRFGITGGSFGGYAGLFLISRVDIFAAAVVRAPPSEFFSTWGDGRDRDIYTIETGQARTGGNPWEVPERYIANSPFFHADRVKTPVLILHGEKDFTVPFQQGEMMFYALRALGRTAEFVIYREGDHSIVRGSRVDFLDYYTRTIDWWNRHLRVGGKVTTESRSLPRGNR